MVHRRISVIIPVYNRSQLLEEVLDHIYRNVYPDYEVIVCDDASTEDIRSIAERRKSVYLRTEVNSGPAAGRNAGAKRATGDILLFVDSDILISPDTLHQINKHITELEHDGVVGVLTAGIRHPNYASVFKNLYIHYTYKTTSPRTSCFYSSIAAVKKEIFEEIGGFDECFGKTVCEDFDFGLRITSKYTLHVLPDLEAEHVRYYTFLGVLKSNFNIASALTRTLLRYRNSNKHLRKDVPSSTGYAMSVALSGLSLLFLCLGFASLYFLPLAAILFILILILNGSFLLFLLKLKGIRFFAVSCLFIYLNVLSHGFGCAMGIKGYVLGNKY